MRLGSVTIELWQLAAALGAVALLAFWLLGGAKPTVRVVEVIEGEAAEIVYATGVVEPKHWAAVGPLLRARIIETCNCEGEAVAKDDVLFRLDASEAEAHLAELVARTNLATRELRRAKDLLQRRVGTQKTYDEALAKLTEYQAAVAAQKRQLENYVSRAPLAGQVLRLDGDVGEVADPGAPLAWVGQSSPRQVIADVNEEDIPRVAVGQRVLLKADAYPDRALKAVVDSITPKGDPLLKTYRVRLALPDETPLFIGMTVDVNIITKSQTGALLIPTAAVKNGAVWVVDDRDRLRRVAVRLGIGGVEHVQLLDGPEVGERIVSPVLQDFSEGQRVRVERAESAEP
ncbi:MAG: efflux RND transporter periplasmic adaptor subunit [Pseudomonadota bacterium]